MDDKTEVVNRNLGDLLRCLVGEHVTSWDSVLPIAEFAYNSYVNRTIGMSPFDVVHGYKPKKYIDLISMAATHLPSKSAQAF